MFWHHLQIFLLSSLLEIFCDGKHHKILLHGYVNCSCPVHIHQFLHFHNYNLRSVFPKNLIESPESDCESWVKPKTIIIRWGLAVIFHFLIVQRLLFQLDSGLKIWVRWVCQIHRKNSTIFIHCFLSRANHKKYSK